MTFSSAIYDSWSPEQDSTSFFQPLFDCGWTCSLTGSVLMLLLFAHFLGKTRENTWCHPHSSCCPLSENASGVQSEPDVSSLHQVPSGFAGQTTVAPHRKQSITTSHLHLPLPFSSSFHPHHHFTIPSHPPHAPLSASFCFLLLFWAIGLLFMASPVEDALLYKTLEPSRRPTSFEDVAHNSYLGL